MTGLASSCGACKFLRRRCVAECVFAPYFCYDEAAADFAAVHKVFGASNVSKLLCHLPLLNRSDAAITISYEALARMQDPIYGCVAYIFELQQQVASLQEEIETLENQMANHRIANAGCGSLQATQNPYFGFQFFSQNKSANTYCYQNHMDDPLFLQIEGTEDQIFNSQPDIGLCTIYGWWDQDFFGDFEPHTLDGLKDQLRRTALPM